MLGFAQLGARRNHAQNMETKLLIGNRMSFVSSLELTLPVFYFNFVTNRRQCTPKFAVALYIGTLFRIFLKNFHFIFISVGKMAHASPELINFFSVNSAKFIMVT